MVGKKDVNNKRSILNTEALKKIRSRHLSSDQHKELVMFLFVTGSQHLSTGLRNQKALVRLLLHGKAEYECKRKSG